MTTPLQRSEQMNKKPVRGEYTLKLQRMPPLMSAVTGPLQAASRPCNKDGGPVNKTNTLVQVRSSHLYRHRVQRRSCSHKIHTPLSKKVTPLVHHTLHSGVKNNAKRSGAPSKKLLEVTPPTWRGQPPQK